MSEEVKAQTITPIPVPEGTEVPKKKLYPERPYIELVWDAAADAGINHDQAYKFYRSFMNGLMNTLAGGRSVIFHGYVGFELDVQKPTTRRNLVENKPMKVAAKPRVKLTRRSNLNNALELTPMSDLYTGPLD